MIDSQEVFKYLTDPNYTDTDGDSLTDRDEVFQYRTNPNRSDTDGDGFDDPWEIRFGSNPLDPASNPGRVNVRVYKMEEIVFDTRIMLW